MISVLKISGIALIALIGAVLLREKHPQSAYFVAVIAFVIITGLSLSGSISSAVGEIGNFVSNTPFSQYAKILLKALGIAYIVSITENICKEAGENTIGEAVILFGKAELILLCLPLISSMLKIAVSLL